MKSKVYKYTKLSLPEGSIRKNFVIFGVNTSSSMHISNKKKDILILGIGLVQKLDDTSLTGEGQ